MGRGKSCAALAAGARSTHYVQLRVEIAGKESNKQEGREEVVQQKEETNEQPGYMVEARVAQQWTQAHAAHTTYLYTVARRNRS